MFTTLLLISATWLSSCNDLVEEDLTDYGVILRTPPDGFTTSANIVQFNWDAVPRAHAYRFQVATPDFSNPVIIVHDSLITASEFTASLSPGSYRWRVRAENPNSRTDYQERALVVEQAASLEGLTPLLIAPANGTITAQPARTFTWQSLMGATDYRFELRSGSQTGTLVSAQIVAGTEILISALDEGSYTWGVQGQNATSASSFSYRMLTVDLTAPGAPVLLAPAAAATLPNTPITFQWQSGASAGPGAVDSLFITHATLGSLRRLAVDGSLHTDSVGTGNFTWQVRTTDAAGNGSSSDLRTFTIQ